jgi:serine/threonine protein kinase
MKASDTIAPDIDSLVAEVADRFTEEVKQGHAPNIEDYAQRHPEIATIIRQVFPALAVLGDFKDGATAGSSSSENPASNVEPPGGYPTHSIGVLGDFRIVREIGRGGMGVVYEAEQVSLGRRVALKVLPFAAMLDRQQLARFKNEARAAATLDHSNIVAIHSVGCERGVHYYAMQLIEGQSLAQVVEQLRAGSKEQGAQSKNSQLPASTSPLAAPESAIPGTPWVPQSAIETEHAALPTLHAPSSSLPAFASREYFRKIAHLGIQAAEALDHAHQNGILHRDVKPANLLVDDTGKLWITDFGLARMEQDAGMTMTGDILGTLRYMSPEQALAKRVVVDHRSDIYSLGVTLYELLTLQPAFAGDDRQELLRKIAFEDPHPPRQINGRIPQDLETIVLKAIEKEPVDRYATAQELRDDLLAFLEHRPVVARPASLGQRARKLLRRHRAVVLATSATLLVALAIGALGLILALTRERELRHDAQQHLELARESVDEMLTKVASTWVADSTATSEVQRQFLERALTIYQQLASKPPDGDPRGADAALAHERISDIQHHLGNFAAATESIKAAVEICQELGAQSGAGAASDEQLVRCCRKLADNLRDEMQLTEALEATDLGLQHAKRLVDQRTATPQLHWELARLLYSHAMLLVASGKLDEASAAIEQANAIVESRLDDSEIPTDQLVLYPQLANLQTIILRRHNRLDDAAATARPAIAALIRIREHYADSKQLLEVEADLRDSLGEVLLAQGDPPKAVEEFREALGLRRQRLGGRNPTQQSFALMFDPRRSVSWRDNEPLATAAYCQTQLRLAAALPSIGRPYEAECMLGEALFNAQINNDSRHDIMAFWVQHASAAAAVGELLTERGSPEAQHYLQLAAALWNEIRPQFPQAVRFVSGMHGASPDWEWFRTSYPDYASQKGTRESLKLQNFQTAFWHHLLGRAWFQNDAWQSAINHFAKSAELRSTGQSYDWLHVAMAYHHLGQPEKAKTEYDRAVARIDDAEIPDPELESLRSTAARLLTEDVP